MLTLADLESKAPRTPIALLPTPLVEASNLARSIAPGQPVPRLLIKRDDLTGLAFGGNKTRKLEWLMGDALRKGAKAVITTGAAQSNHARQTAAAAAKLGLKAYLVLRPPVEGQGQGNLLIDELVGAKVILRDSKEQAEREIQVLAARLAAAGEPAYIIPVGGSTPIGAIGYTQAMIELREQYEALGIKPAALYFASSSGGTHGGLLVGARGGQVDGQIWGVTVEPNAGELREEIVRIANEETSLLGLDLAFTTDEILLEECASGPAYGMYTKDADEALRLAAKTEGLLLDPVYTAKALAGLMAHIREGRYRPDETVVFLHTGGTPALFAYADQLAHPR